MERLRRAIEDDLRQFAHRVDAAAPPDLRRYEQATGCPDAVDRAVRWLESGEPAAPPAYLEYIALHLRARAAHLRFRARDRANRCIVCFEDLGRDNPRQLCLKTFCPHQA